MNKKTLILPLAALALVSCGGNTNSTSEKVDDYNLEILSPTGAPAVAMFDQGTNSHYTTLRDTTQVGGSFLTGAYDAIIFDGTNGLNNLIKNELETYSLARWLTGGNFYLVSTKYTAEDEIAAGSTFLAFGESNVPAKVFRHLAKESWNIDVSSTVYVNGVELVMQALTTNPTSYDYYFIAEPVLTNARNTLKEQGVTVNEIYNLRTEWEKLTGQKAIPQAALFIKNSTYEAHKTVVDTFLDHIEDNIDLAINNPAEVKKIMDEQIPSVTDQAAKFAFNSNLVNNLQSNGNRFGLIAKGDIEDNKAFADTFMSTLNGETYSYPSSLFLA